MKLPAFELLADSGESRTHKDYLGQPLVLYFYPKDDTPGCTKEACSFRDRFPDFTAIGARVLGVSQDRPEVHASFRKRHGLPFELLFDEGGKLARELGVGKSLFGLLPGRETLVFNAEGELLHRFESQWKIHEHIEQALKALKAG